MSNSLLFEGRDLEEVLGEARLCFGPDVEIEAATRVRKGGVFGFFAREWFEVWAHGPSSTAAVSAENPALALLDREASMGDEVDSFQSMVANALAEQTGPDHFQEAMNEFFTVDESAAEIGRAARSRTGETPRPSEAAAVAADLVRGSVATLERPAMPETAPAVTASVAAAPTTPAAVALEDAPRGASVFAEERVARPAVLWQMLEHLESVVTTTSMPESGIVVFVGDAALALPAVQALGQQLGMWSNEVSVVSRRTLDAVPTWLSIDSDEDLAARLPRWRRREGVVPVIIDQPIDAPKLDATLQILDTIEPAQVRLVTEAWRLPEQTGRLAGRFGGVDVIDLVDTADSLDPLGMIDLDIPIGSVEGRPASPELLAAVWLDRRRHG